MKKKLCDFKTSRRGFVLELTYFYLKKIDTLKAEESKMRLSAVKLSAVKYVIYSSQFAKSP